MRNLPAATASGAAMLSPSLHSLLVQAHVAELHRPAQPYHRRPAVSARGGEICRPPVTSSPRS
jgi:hypothetical protein